MVNKKKVNYDVITSEQLMKIERASRRNADLEKGTFIRTGPHWTSKRDEESRESNTLSVEELKELLAEEPSDDDEYYDGQ